MLVRANSFAGCLLCDLELGAAGSGRISASVGAGGANAKADVLTIQKLLNGVAPEDGGPTPTLIEDGFIGPITRGAIAAFQKRQNLKIQDDRIDPLGPTLKRLNELSSPFRRRSVLDREGAARLGRVGGTMAYLVSANAQAEHAVEAAMDHLTLGGGGLFDDMNARAYRRADLYFRFGAQAQARTIDELRFIRTTIGRVRTVLTSRSPFGAAIFDVDPLRTHPEYMAYSPMQLGDPNRKDGTTSLRIYLCDGIDARPQDHFAHILSHELFHFVDDETKDRWIIDAPHGYRDGAMRLSHEQRMHNADNYALFVTHTTIGRARLIASQPMLSPYVPADMP